LEILKNSTLLLLLLPPLPPAFFYYFKLITYLPQQIFLIFILFYFILGVGGLAELPRSQLTNLTIIS
jgi:hypothetical protein